LNSQGELLLKDYPFAEDGLAIYDIMHQWMREYVNIYYKSDANVTADVELQAWWKEVQVSTWVRKSC
jgi:arachidonate 15-lipoxygenase